MNQKTLEDEGDGFREKGSNLFPGKIMKGTLNEAPIKIKVSSIPAKHQNVIYRSFSQPAFGDSTSKFYEPTATQKKWNPGPGNYNHENNDSKIYSKKGLGSFASSTKLSRLERTRSHGPGPGTYAIKSSLKPNKNKSLKHSLKDNRKTSASFMSSSQVTNTALLSSQIQNRDIFKYEIKRAKMIPGPGRYDFNPEGTFQNHLQGKLALQSMGQRLKLKKSGSLMNYNFKSKLQRFSLKEQNVPPVGYYDVARKPADSQKKTVKYDDSKFQKDEKQILEEKIEKMFTNEDDMKGKSKVGPGTYNPKIIQSSNTFSIRHTIHDRFGNLKPVYAMAKTVSLENQGHEEEMRMQQYQTSKQDTAGTDFTSNYGNQYSYKKGPDSMFKSATKRSQLILQNKIGPCKYNLQKSPQKKSHLINFNRKWVGV